MTTQNQALATREQASIDRRADRSAFEPTSFDELTALSIKLHKSGLMPSGLDTPEKVQVAIMMGRELGLSVMQACRSIHVIEGKPALSSSLIMGLCVKEARLCRYFMLVESTDEKATYETWREGAPAAVRISYKRSQAQTANLLAPTRNGKPSNHVKHPAAMLRARCETALARAVYPDLVGGLYDPDELEHAPHVERDVTPSRPTLMTQAAVVVADTAAPDAAVVVATAPGDGESFAFRFAIDAIEKAQTKVDLMKVGALIGESKKANEITGADVATLKAAFQARTRAIEAATPPAAEVEL